jgi:hypothetical protein
MKVEFTLKLKPADFKDFKTFSRAVNAQLGENVYVGTDMMVVPVYYSKELAAMLRPYPPQEQFEFKLEFGR